MLNDPKKQDALKEEVLRTGEMQMFEIYETRADRAQTLNRLFEVNQNAGFLIACADFEWTVRRVILALGEDTTKVIRTKEMSGDDGYVCGLKSYKTLWNKEVKSLHNDELDDLLNRSVNVKDIPDYDARFTGSAWEFLDKAFGVRAQLIHGVRGHASSATSNFMFHLVRACTEVLCDYAEENNWSIFGKKIVKLKPRE